MKKIAIIGAGPAGLSASIHLASLNKNHEIHLFERGKIGDNIICAEGFFDFFGTLNIELPEKMRVKKIILLAEKEIVVNLPQNSNILTFDRTKWQKNLAKEATTLGVKIFENTKIEKNEIKKLSSKYDYLLDCSGFYGVTHHLFPKREVSEYRKNLIPALQYKLEGDFSKYEGTFYVKVFDKPPGYFWLFPRKENNEIKRANAGLGLLIKRRNSINLRDLLNKMVENKFCDYNIEGYSSSPIPTKRMKTFMNKNIILLGDALGLCSPLHGGGIDSAYLSGYYVAHSIVNNDFSYYNTFLKKLDNRFYKERLILRLWKLFGSLWLLKRLENKGLFSEKLGYPPFSGKWLNKAIIKIFF